MIKLPTEKRKAVVKNPRNLIIFSKPKVGKTTLLAELPNCLILDFEGGADPIDAMAIRINSIAELKEVGEAIKNQNAVAGKPMYDYIAIDTTTALERMCIDYAEEIYSATAAGKNWYTKGKVEYGTIIGMPNGGGYHWLRQAYENVIKYVHSLSPTIIQLAHVKDVFLNKSGVEVNALEIDLTGLLKRTTCADSDAIGYLHRRKDGNYISFKTSDDVLCGSRFEHLSNVEFRISEKNSDGTFTTHWDKIFKP